MFLPEQRWGTRDKEGPGAVFRVGQARLGGKRRVAAWSGLAKKLPRPGWRRARCAPARLNSSRKCHSSLPPFPTDAKKVLEKGKEEFGVHRVKAIRLIDDALDEIKKAVKVADGK